MPVPQASTVRARIVAPGLVRLAVVVAAAAIIGVGCRGGSSATTTAPTTVASTVVAPPTTAPPLTLAPIETLPTVTAPGEPTIKDAIVWASDDGSASLEISTDWAVIDPGGSLGAWSVNNGEATVNVVSEEVGELTAQEYLDISIESINKIDDLELVDSGLTLGATGAEIGYVESAGRVGNNANVTYHYMSTFNAANGKVTVATFAAPSNNFAGIIDQVRPYLNTVRSL